jgi:hypothetical protein
MGRVVRMVRVLVSKEQARRSNNIRGIRHGNGVVDTNRAGE